MTKRITIIYDDDYDAFTTDSDEQFDRICGMVKYILQHDGKLNIFDSNGNKVGFISAD